MEGQEKAREEETKGWASQSLMKIEAVEMATMPVPTAMMTRIGFPFILAYPHGRLSKETEQTGAVRIPPMPKQPCNR
jgi:hypothetical protein